MSPRSSRPAIAHPPDPETEPDRNRHSDDGLRVRLGRWEIAAKGASAVYAAALAACIVGLAYVTPPLFAAIHEATQALHDGAATLKEMAAEVRETHAAVGEMGRTLDAKLPAIEARVVAIETDVSALRNDLKMCRRP